MSVTSHNLQCSKCPRAADAQSQKRFASQPKNHQPAASPPPSANAGLRRHPPQSVRPATTRAPPMGCSSSLPGSSYPPRQLPKRKKNRSPFLPLISVDLSVHSRCAAWAIWPRKLGVEQGGRCCRHGVIRAPDWDLNGCGVEGQCCFSLGESLRCDGGWVCSLIDSWSFDMSFV